MSRPSALDELFVHQTPDLLAHVAQHHPHWRESYFFELHRPDAAGDVIFFTMAQYPALQVLDSLQMGKVAGQPVLGRLDRPYGDDPHTTALPGARIEIVRAWDEVRLHADETQGAAIGLDLTFRARTQPYALRRGTMRAGSEVIWDQSHILQSGIYTGTYSVGGTSYDVDGWIGQRDHSWGIRDHGRCPLWMWLQIQLDDGFLGVWHWELTDGARVYTDGCWAPTDGTDPIPLVDFAHDLTWLRNDRDAARYGANGDDVSRLAGTCRFTLRGGRVITVDAEGTFDRPYEPFRRGGLSQMRVRTDDGRQGTAIYEITGARHHRYFPDTVVEETLPG
jgi:hypothetical protein